MNDDISSGGRKLPQPNDFVHQRISKTEKETLDIAVFTAAVRRCGLLVFNDKFHFESRQAASIQINVFALERGGY